MKKMIGTGPVLSPLPLLVIGSYDHEERADAMTAAWGGVCCSAPPCVAFSVRESRYTYENLLEREEFTINIPSASFVAEVDYFGIVSGRNIDKPTICGLTMTPAPDVHAPMVEEFPLALECRMVKTVSLGSHLQVIGEIVGILADEEILDEDGNPVPGLMDPILYDPRGKKYYRIGEEIGQAFISGKKFQTTVYQI
ncbi:MAG TPA: flavin reductase family protein [Methanoculleus sp.]|nr:flavin reductase family protein [Methanoculleus sp.]